MPNKYKYGQGGKLVGGQHKLDKDKDGDIDGDDFKMMKHGGEYAGQPSKEP